MKKNKSPPTEQVVKPALAIRAVYVRKSSLEINDEFNPLVPGQKLNGAFTWKPDGYVVGEIPAGEGRPDVTRSIAFQNQFNFVFHFGDPLKVAAPLSADAPKTAAALSACISVDYLLTGDLPEPEEMAKYANNSMVHAWPYWREYCHSSMLRMQLPVVLAPLLSLTERKAETVEAPPPDEDD